MFWDIITSSIYGILIKNHSALIPSLTEVNTNYVQQPSVDVEGTRNTYIHMRMKKIQYFSW